MMIPNSTIASFILLVFGVSAAFIMMLLPALYELKKPRDAGPRIIMDEPIILQHRMIEATLGANIEEDFRLGQPSLNGILDIIGALTNLEA
jgi:hypothetical protein